MVRLFVLLLTIFISAGGWAQSGAPTNIATYANCQSSENPTPTVYSAALGKYCRYNAVACDVTFTQKGSAPQVQAKPAPTIAGVQCPAILNPKTGVYTCPSPGACASYVTPPKP